MTWFLKFFSTARDEWRFMPTRIDSASKPAASDTIQAINIIKQNLICCIEKRREVRQTEKEDDAARKIQSHVHSRAHARVGLVMNEHLRGGRHVMPATTFQQVRFVVDSPLQSKGVQSQQSGLHTQQRKTCQQVCVC